MSHVNVIICKGPVCKCLEELEAGVLGLNHIVELSNQRRKFSYYFMSLYLC